MFKLTVVGGPAKGASYQVKDGENTIGRVDGNDIVLSSNKVSKKHCTLVVNNKEVIVKDLGSSNGTFVNGILTKLKKLLPGDRVSVGEYVFELVKLEAAHASKPQQQFQHSADPNALPMGPVGNVIAFPGAGMNSNLAIPSATSPNINTGAAPIGGAAAPSGNLPPKDFKEKIKFYFEQYIINFVYNLNETHEWRSLMTGMFVILVFLCTLISVYPVLERVHEKLEGEAANRAFLLARQIVERNAPYVYEKIENKIDVGFIDKEPGVLAAYLIDMEGRVMAPSRKLNQYLTEPNEASFSALTRKYFYEKESRERYAKAYGTTIAAAVPLKVFNSSTGKNVSVALGLVFFDESLLLFDSGTEAMAYIQALILSAIIGVVIFFSLYRLTLRPLLELNNDVDQVLKGNASQVNNKFKMEEIAPLIDVVNAALQRVTTSSSGGGTVDPAAIEEVINMLKFTADRMTGAGVMVFSGDRKIAHLNAIMEEITGIRKEGAIGADISAAARDAAFVAFVEDILGRAPVGGVDVVVEDFEFSGSTYKMEALAIGQMGAVKAYWLSASKVS